MDKWWKRIYKLKFFKEVSAIGLALLWGLISIGLRGFEGGKSYFEPGTIIECKILLVAIIFLGRYLLFPQYRNRYWWKLYFSLTFLGILSARIVNLIPAKTDGFYFLFVAVDVVIWSVLLACLLELVGAVFTYWYFLTKNEFQVLHQLWRRFWDEILKFGLFSSLTMGLAYYYLVSFYLVDTLFYSYLLSGLLWLTGLGLYSIITAKLHRWLQPAINLIDQETVDYLDWPKFNGEWEFDAKFPRYRYLLLTRDYLVKLKKPVVSIKILICYLLFGGFLLILPYIFGIVVEVNSFK